MLLSVALFSVGLFGFLSRKNVLVMFLAFEVMLNASGLFYVGAGASADDGGGQVMFLLILSAAAAEIAVALALIFALKKEMNTLDNKALVHLKG
jgi:NADH-quinone oxidoreductase subunit K